MRSGSLNLQVRIASRTILTGKDCAVPCLATHKIGEQNWQRKLVLFLQCWVESNSAVHPIFQLRILSEPPNPHTPQRVI